MDILDLKDDPNYKKVTVQEVIEAIRRNGIEKYEGNFFNYAEPVFNYLGESYTNSDKYYPEKTVIAACALGQAAINLEVDADSLYMYLYSFADAIAAFNDSNPVSLQEIADYAEKRWTEDYSQRNVSRISTEFYVKRQTYGSVKRIS